VNRTTALSDDNQVVTYGDLKKYNSTSTPSTASTGTSSGISLSTVIATLGSSASSTNTGGTAAALTNVKVLVVKEGDAGQPVIGRNNLGQTSYSLIYLMYAPIDDNRDHVEVWSQSWLNNTRPETAGNPPADATGSPEVDWVLEGILYPTGYATYVTTAALGSGDLSIVAKYGGTDTNTLFPTTGPFFVQIDNEYILVSSASVTGAVYTLTVPAGGRGKFGTTAASHLLGASIYPMYVWQSGWLSLPNQIVYPIFDFAAAGFTVSSSSEYYSLTHTIYGNSSGQLVTIPMGTGGNYTNITTEYSTNGASTPRIQFSSGKIVIDNGSAGWAVTVDGSGVEITGPGATSVTLNSSGNVGISGIVSITGSETCNGAINAGGGFKVAGVPGIARGPENLVTTITPVTTSITYVTSVDFVGSTVTTDSTTVITGLTLGVAAHTFTGGLLTA
jgi:hypothetical protein